MKPLFVAVQIWIVALVICMAVTAWSFLHIDLQVAHYFSKYHSGLNPLGRGLGSAVILSGEALTVLALILARLMRGNLPPPAEVLAIACLTSICAYGIGSGVLKVFFGVPNPGAVAQGATHAFNFLKGSPFDSFPSGHMVLAGAFAGVFMRFYRTSIWFLGALMMLGCALLVVGGWHFVSDVIAGTFLGLSAGLLSGEFWKIHSN